MNMAASAHPQMSEAPEHSPRIGFRFGLDAARVWPCLLAGCRPFRDGTRFEALPDLRYWRDGAHIRAPANELPNDNDIDVQAYLRRLRRAHPRADIELRVDEPLILDAPLWERARGLLRELLGGVGVPISPVTTALVLSCRASPMAAAKRAAAGDILVQVLLYGEMRWRGGAAEYRLRPGDAIRLLAHGHAMRCEAARALWLELRIPSFAADLETMIENLMTRLLSSAREEEDTPHDLPFPPPRRALSPMPWMQRLAEELSANRTHAALQQALEISWMMRLSTHGLEPPVPVANVARLRRTDRVRLCVESVVRRRVDRRNWVWAVNGHPLAMEDSPALSAVWSRLCDGRTHRVVDLLRTTGPDRPGPEVATWLQRMYALRGLARVGED
ncbi:MAG: hypothetical protein E6Q88_01600 [Lysobacteraceae bacterium]|nr:MAG: hypothetical protein E6Q88_01600 [Xanthomonadaceae bacterium]